jgi:hypothetical protein|tara:strand:+ start:3791 stop:6163 length:2373 start_codon:yes stop_codon:yes gene_type:complete
MRTFLLFVVLSLICQVDYALQSDHPDSSGNSAALRQHLKDVFDEKRGTYAVRTRHLDDKGQPLYTNRLLLEDSPYLLQHAHNPVDWYPWGAEAFEKARLTDKPVFLSIGYSTCHWCHVMEDESFDDESVAAILNSHFVAIKVDREQRPDVDEIYMTGVQLITGQGGWPMSNFLTADGKPFYAGTYYPKENFIHLLQQVVGSWDTQRAKIVASAEQISKQISVYTSAIVGASEIDHEVVKDGVAQLLADHDDENGGFGGRPKFPNETRLLLLLDAYRRDDNLAALAAVEKTLTKMASGGIYDQIGGGFHRYSVDEYWLVPHFEKMLYNQAQLTRVYAVAFSLTGSNLYRRILEQTLDYVLRDMRHEGGAFYSATDADSEGEEGLFFVWTIAQLREQLSEEEADLAIDVFGVTSHGNFEGSNILHLPVTIDAYADANDVDELQVLDRLDEIRAKLYRHRESRPHPLRDEKIISSWNGMMISSLVVAAEVLQRSDYLQAAVRAAEYLWQHSRSDEEGLRRIVLRDKASIQSSLDDYSYLSEACLYLFDATGDDRWLMRAERLVDEMIDLFWDAEQGGFYMGSAVAGEPMITRPKSPMDGAIASGNSVALGVLIRLLQRTGKLGYKTKIVAMINAFSGLIKVNPSGLTTMLLGVDEYMRGSTESRQFAANGHIRANARTEANEQMIDFEIELTIDRNWHVNAHDVDQKEQVPTRVLVPGKDWQIEEVSYPTGEAMQVAFQRESLQLYTGTTVIKGRLKVDGAVNTLLPLTLELQACDEELCLPPEQLAFKLPSH